MLIMPSTFQLLKSIEERTGSRFSLPEYIIFSPYLHCWVLWMHLEWSQNQIHNKPQMYSLHSQTIIGWKETRPVPWTAILLLRVSPWRRVIGPPHWTSSIRSLMHGCHSKIEMLTFASFTEQSELLSSLNRGSVVNNCKEQMMMKHRENLQDSCRSKDSYMTLFWFFFSFHWVKVEIYYTREGNDGTTDFISHRKS